MPIALEDFTTLSPSQMGLTPDTILLSQAESAKATAYEQGYKAGWDDAINTDAQEQARIGSEFARHLQEMSFSFHEARTHVIQSVEPLLDALMQTFLPNLVRDSMGQQIVEALQPILDDCAESPVQILVADGARSAIEQHLQGTGLGVFELVEEPTLADGQAFIKLGKAERHIDLSGAFEQVRQSMSAMSQINERAVQNG